MTGQGTKTPQGQQLIPFTAPRIKAAHLPLRTPDGTIQIGGDIYGVAGVLEDPDGWMWSVLQLLDGRRSPAEILQAAVHSPDEVAELMNACYEAGHLEDAAADETTLTQDQQERYSRSRSFFQWIDTEPRPSMWSVQELVTAARVTVVGVGGAGTHVATILTAAGIGSLSLVDPDVVELSNLSRQTLFAQPDIGRPKVEAAIDRLRAINSTVSLDGRRTAVTTEAELRAVATDSDVVALCADEPRDIASMASRVFAESSTPWVGGGYRGPMVDVRISAPGKGPCFDCMRRARHGEPEPDLQGNDLTNHDIASSSAVSASLTGTLIAHGVLTLVTGAPAMSRNFSMGVNLAGPDQNLFLAPEGDPHCPVCGQASTVEC